MNKIKQKLNAFYGDNTSNIHWLFAFVLTIIATDVLSERKDDHVGKSIWLMCLVAICFQMVRIMFIDFWRRYIKPKFIKWLAKDIAATFARPNVGDETPINLSIDEINKSWVKPMHITWQAIYDAWPNSTLIDNATDDVKLSNILHRQYVSPIHNWCVDNLDGNFFLWSDSKGVNLLLIETRDRVLWKLTWNNILPTPQEVFAFAHIT